MSKAWTRAELKEMQYGLLAQACSSKSNGDFFQYFAVIGLSGSRPTSKGIEQYCEIMKASSDSAYAVVHAFNCYYHVIRKTRELRKGKEDFVDFLNSLRDNGIFSQIRNGLKNAGMSISWRAQPWTIYDSMRFSEDGLVADILVTELNDFTRKLLDREIYLRAVGYSKDGIDMCMSIGEMFAYAMCLSQCESKDNYYDHIWFSVNLFGSTVMQTWARDTLEG